MTEKELLTGIKESLAKTVADLQAEKRQQETVGWQTILNEELVEKMSDSISERVAEAVTFGIAQVKIEAPSVTVPEVKVPEAKVTVDIPEIKIPDIHVPAPQVTVNVPEIQLPVINVPEPKVTVNVEKPDPIVIPPFPEIAMPDVMNVQGNVGITNDRSNAIPVVLTTIDGKPYEAVGGGSGGARQVKATIENPDQNYGTSSTLNTTTQPLGSGATYTGTFEQNDFPDVMVSCIADNTGTLYFDFSVDGTNVYTFPTNGFVVSSGLHEFHIGRKGSRYFRARFVNDSGTQTYMRLYTYYGSFGQAMAPLNQGTSTDADAILVRHAYDPLEAAQGKISGVTALNKFGQAPNGVQTSLTDIWGRADATPTQQIWLAPTAARVHALVSTSTDDDGSPVGAGARTVRVYGLTSWSTAETSEDITLNGTDAVNTVNAYVIIHRMKVLTSGATSINVGTISATAATDGTITAVILPGKGQTQLAIYGIPSVQTLYLTSFDFSLHDTAAVSKEVDCYLVVNENPNVQTTNFIVKINGGVNGSGSTQFVKNYNPYMKIPGPAIVKVQALASIADSDCSANFDGYLVTN